MKDYTSYIKEYKKEKFNDNFWKWFGDSKVVDNAGNPLVVYHGSRSSKKFNTFKTDSPIWFTKAMPYADAFIDKTGTLFKVYIKLENPIYVGDIDGIVNVDSIDILSKLTDLDINILKDILKETNGVNLFNITNSNTFKKLMQDRGYDGIEAREGRGLTTYAVFSSNQVKSATGNNGNYSKESDSILEYNSNNSVFNDSKVVDKNGKLLVVYHGTNRNFDKFINMGETDTGYYGVGYYFTADKEYAKEYGSIIMNCYLNIKNPFLLTTDSSDSSDALFDLRDSLSTLNGMPKNLKTNRTLPDGYYIKKEVEQHYGQSYTVYAVYPEEKYYGTDKEIYSNLNYNTELAAIVYFNDQLKGIDYDCGWATSLLKKVDRDNLSNILRKNGYDGIFVENWKNKEINEYVVFESDQIKIINVEQ